MSEERKSNWGAYFFALFIMVIFPLGFYLYFEHLRQQGSATVKQLPVLSTDSMPVFSFINQDGDTITQDSLNNTIVIADYFYTTCPGICTKLTNSMEEIQNFIKKNDGLQSRIRLLSHSVDPANDTLGRLKVYAKEHHVDDHHWWLLTGDKKALYDLAIHFYKIPVQEVKNDSGATEPFIHSERLVLLDKKGIIRGFYDGTDSVKVKNLIGDLVNLDIYYAIKQGIDEKRVTRGAPPTK